MGERAEAYRVQLRGLKDWEPFLKKHSGLPGPRANLELVAAVVEEGDADRLWRLSASRDEFLALCGTAGLGRIALLEPETVMTWLRELSSDPRWRVREGVAIALRRLGDEGQPRQVAHRGFGQDPRVPGTKGKASGQGEAETKAKGGTQTQADDEALDPLEDDDRNRARSQRLLGLEVVDDCSQPRPLFRIGDPGLHLEPVRSHLYRRDRICAQIEEPRRRCVRTVVRSELVDHLGVERLHIGRDLRPARITRHVFTVTRLRE